MRNQMRIFFDAVSENEAFARLVAAGFFAQLNPTIAEITDVKTAVSEAVTNAIIHGYEGKGGTVELFCAYDENRLQIEVADRGIGITNIAQAMEPLYTSKPELERSGMGFTIMETFMDKMRVESIPHFGTRVYMEKDLKTECGDSLGSNTGIHSAGPGRTSRSKRNAAPRKYGINLEHCKKILWAWI
ncbi:MAG: anti-sigma F factor [Anaerotignum sp.]|uniref:anti-sigma F factor n=2 Tax=Anaerotignum sp. TaxID=2039241 RepID=UPI003994124A